MGLCRRYPNTAIACNQFPSGASVARDILLLGGRPSPNRGNQRLSALLDLTRRNAGGLRLGHCSESQAQIVCTHLSRDLRLENSPQLRKLAQRAEHRTVPGTAKVVTEGIGDEFSELGCLQMSCANTKHFENEARGTALKGRFKVGQPIGPSLDGSTYSYGSLSPIILRRVGLDVVKRGHKIVAAPLLIFQRTKFRCGRGDAERTKSTAASTTCPEN